MLISDMAPGTPISLELSIADAHYEIPTTIVSSKPGYILIAPFSFNGTVIDLDSSKNMVINVYTIDPLTENRIVWRNVCLETISYKTTSFESAYYKISTNAFASLPSTCDRRNARRTSINASGWIILDRDGLRIPITICNVSDHGLSFITPDELDSVSTNIYINFSDEAHGKNFNLNFKCIIVRTLPHGEDHLYGCSIPVPSRDYLTYVFLKKLDYKINAVQKQADLIKSDKTTDNTEKDNTGKGFHSNLGNHKSHN